MDNRERILDAAARVYAQHGFRGATTRLIATEAGVNEVTLFRTFGSKAGLFDAMMRSHADGRPLPELPDTAVDPEGELGVWCTALLTSMRENRSIIRKSLSDLEERPDAAVTVCEGPNCAATQLMAYVGRLQAQGIARTDADVATAVSMFMSALFGDAMCREVIPESFPQPAESAPVKYVSTFLRSVGATAPSHSATSSS